MVVALAMLLPTAMAAQSTYEELQAFSGVLNQVRRNYVDSVTAPQLVRSAIQGMLRSLDPHSYYLPRAQAARIDAWEAGELAGIGVALEMVEDRITVLAVFPHSPADRVGLRPGDRLLVINDSTTSGRTSSQVRSLLIGPRGTEVNLLLERGSRLEPDTLRLKMKSDFLKPDAIGSAIVLDGRTGYVRLTEFNATAARELEDAIQNLHPQRLILDLRGNPGGRLYQAEEVAALFFPDSTLVFRTEGRRRNVRQRYFSKKDGRFLELPLVVLIDGGSASAAEILAGSLQDHDRALLVGRRSFGKALMQMPFVIPPRGDMVFLTIGYVLTPSGRLIQRPYHGLTVEEYTENGGTDQSSSVDSTTFLTDRGRSVRAGGGIAPDVRLPPVPAAPAWLSVAIDRSVDVVVADSVANASPAPKALPAWVADSASWSTMVAPFRDHVRRDLEVEANIDAGLARYLARRLAARVAGVRWGREGRELFEIRTDPDVAAAVAAFDSLPAMLNGP